MSNVQTPCGEARLNPHVQTWPHHLLAGCQPDRRIQNPGSALTSALIPVLAFGGGLLIGGTCFLVSPDAANEVMVVAMTPVALSFAFFRSRK
jgi:hypothetical protein